VLGGRLAKFEFTEVDPLEAREPVVGGTTNDLQGLDQIAQAKPASEGVLCYTIR